MLIIIHFHSFLPKAKIQIIKCFFNYKDKFIYYYFPQFFYFMEVSIDYLDLIFYFFPLIFKLIIFILKKALLKSLFFIFQYLLKFYIIFPFLFKFKLNLIYIK